MPLPYGLRQEFIKGNVVLFVGAGFVKNYLPKALNWGELLKSAFQRLKGDKDEIFNYATPTFDYQGQRIIHPSEYLRLAQQFELAREGTNIPPIHDIVQELVSKSFDRDEAVNALSVSVLNRVGELPLSVWITTNFDSFLEDTIFHDALNAGVDQVFARPIRNVDFGLAAAGGRTLFKIHGSVASAKPKESIVITEEDYHRFLRDDRYIVNKLYTLFCERTVVFLGYSLSDPNIHFVYNEVLFDQKLSKTEQAISFSQVRPAFFVTREAVNDLQRSYFRRKRIQYLDNLKIEDFFSELLLIWQNFETGKGGITKKIEAEANHYKEFVNFVDWNIDPDTVTVPENDRPEWLGKLLDLIELQELVYRASGSTTKVSDIDPASLTKCTIGSVRIIKKWGRDFMTTGRTDILELILDFLRSRLRPRSAVVFRDLLDAVSWWLRTFPNVPGADTFVQRYCSLLFSYDWAFNAWDDYVYCLEHYVHATQMFSNMSHALRRRVTSGLYEQLRMCGRDVGDSWYTTDKVYSVWSEFNPDAWPMLEELVKSKSRSWKNDQILLHLAPGKDFKLFMPR